MLGNAPLGSAPLGAPLSTKANGATGFAAATSTAEGAGASIGELDLYSHRYWRIINYANATTQTGVGELEMAGGPAGPNLCSGGTPFASGTYGGSYVPASAFDGNQTSNWFQDGGGGYAGAFLGYDFGTPVAIHEVRVIGAVEELAATPRIFDVQWSDDGDAWNWAWTCFNVDWQVGIPVSFPEPTPQLANPWWGLFVEGDGNGAHDMVLAEMQLRGTAGGSDLTSTAAASTVYPLAATYTPSSLFDDNGGTIVYTGDANRGVVVAYPFDVATVVAQVALTASNDSNAVRAPKDGWLLYSQNGRSWKRGGRFSGQTYSGGQTKAFATDIYVPPPPANRAGVAAATSAASAAMFATGTIQARGQGTALGSADGRSNPSRPAAGAAAATSQATGVSFVIGTIRTAGAAAATSGATSAGFATGIIQTTGVAAGLGGVSANGTGIHGNIVGAASAAGAAVGVGSYAPSTMVGRADGVGQALARVTRITASRGLATGFGDVVGVAARVVALVGVAAGQGDAQGASGGRVVTIGAGGATSSALGAGVALHVAVGAAASVASAAATGTQVRGMAGGPVRSISTAVAVGRGQRAARGGSVGTSTVEAVGVGLSGGAGAATGSSTASGTSRELHAAVGWSTAFSLVEAIGVGRAGTRGVGSATSSAIGAAVRLDSGVSPEDLLVVDPPEITVVVLADIDALVVVAVDDPFVIVPEDRFAALAA